MKALLLSVRPEHAINIINGNKTLELRKSVPKGFKGWVYVYVTKGKPYLQDYTVEVYGIANRHFTTTNIDFKEKLNGTVPFRFWFDEFDFYNPFYFSNTGVNELDYLLSWETKEKLSLEDEDVRVYGKGKDLYAWHIKKLDIFPKPMRLGDFEKEDYDVMPTNGVWPFNQPITKAPQSYMYVYVKEELK